MPLTDKDKLNDDALADKLEELESLLHGKDTGLDERSAAPAGSIPVLDDPINPDDYTGSDSGFATADLNLSNEHLLRIAENIEMKIGAELDKVLMTLKGELKQRVLNELLSQTTASDDPQPAQSVLRPGTGNHH